MMIGQENVLKNITSDKSYLITGPRGCGKTSLAMEIVQKLVEPKHLHLLPDNYPDLHVLNGGKIEDVQNLIRKITVKPFYSKHFVILDNINNMTREAQTLLLKQIEDTNTIFILTSNNDLRVLPTIFSRCNKISPMLLETSLILSLLNEKYPHEDKNYLTIVSNLCEFSLGKAYKYVENDTLRSFIKDLQELKKFDSFVIATKYDAAKEERDDIISIIEKYIRDKMVEGDNIKKQKYFKLVEEMKEYKKHMFQNVSIKTIYRNIFLELIELEH